MSCANIGRSAVADEKNVAKKSTSIVPRIIGEVKTKRRPSFAAASENSSRRDTPGFRGGRGMGGIISSATRTALKEMALNTYAQPTL